MKLWQIMAILSLGVLIAVWQSRRELQNSFKFRSISKYIIITDKKRNNNPTVGIGSFVYVVDIASTNKEYHWIRIVRPENEDIAKDFFSCEGPYGALIGHGVLDQVEIESQKLVIHQIIFPIIKKT